MKKIKLDVNEFLKDRSYIEPDNLPKYARLIGKDEIVVLYYDFEGCESDRLKFEKMGYEFAEIEWLNLAEPLSPDDLNPQVEYYEDLINRFCLKSFKGVVCFCSTHSECNLFDECLVSNAARDAMNIKAT